MNYWGWDYTSSGPTHLPAITACRTVFFIIVLAVATAVALINLGTLVEIIAGRRWRRRDGAVVARAEEITRIADEAGIGIGARRAWVR